MRHGLDVLKGGSLGEVPEIGVVRVWRTKDHGSHVEGRRGVIVVVVRCVELRVHRGGHQALVVGSLRAVSI